MIDPIAGVPELDRHALAQIGPAVGAELGNVAEVVETIRVPPVSATEPDARDGRYRLNVIRIVGVDSGGQLSAFRCFSSTAAPASM